MSTRNRRRMLMVGGFNSDTGIGGVSFYLK